MAGMQILSVEDNENQSALVSFLLQEAGHTVQTANSAEKALEVLRSFTPDLILMDLQLQGMDGLELTRRLRLDPVQATTPIIALTAYTDPSDLERAREAGCNGKIPKPIDTVAFARQVTQYMNPAAVMRAEPPCDSSDLLAELRNDFLAEGLEHCSTILKELKSGPGCAIEVIQRVFHRLVVRAETLGFPEISDQAGRIEAVLASASPASSEIEKAVQTALQWFSYAARHKPRLPLDLITGLNGVRIGLVNFSEEGANRIRSATQQAHIESGIEQIRIESIERQTSYDALIINECNISAQAALHRAQVSIPAVYIRSRSSLQSLSNLPARSYDFLVAPWDAEEVLLRLYRLIGKSAPPQPASGSPDKKKTSTRVLIADDDPDIVAIVCETLQQFEMNCDIARSGEQALEAVRRHPPDAIVLDVNMPDLDGFEVLKRLRRNLLTKDIAVLLMTARHDASDINRGLGLGADDYVVKPFKPLDLVKRVNKVISDRRKPSSSG